MNLKGLFVKHRKMRLVWQMSHVSLMQNMIVERCHLRSACRLCRICHTSFSIPSLFCRCLYMAIRSMNDVIVISVDLKYSFFMWNYF